MKNEIILGDCGEILKKIDSETFNLIITSPPYADARKNYPGIHPDNYVSWFSPIAENILRTLKNDGSFILNIKEKVMDGERHTYVLDLIKEMKKLGWIWTEEYIWHKKNATPGKWPNRFRDAWERLLHFTKSKKFKMNQESVKKPIGDWACDRMKNLSSNDMERTTSATKSGFGRNVSNWLNKETVYPDNVLYLAAECGNKKHSAVFPVTIPEWFIKLFTDENDMILDPFMGSGSTAIACLKNNRNYVGIEILKEYALVAENRIKEYMVKNDSTKPSLG